MTDRASTIDPVEIDRDIDAEVSAKRRRTNTDDSEAALLSDQDFTGNTEDGVDERSQPDADVTETADDGGDRTYGPSGSRVPTRCPYLDTIQLKMLDFDFEKICSQTLSNINIYACLVCGAFFQGRGKKSPAYVHAVEEGHYIFLNLKSGQIYCLPDSYEVQVKGNRTLEDIVYNLHPSFDKGLIKTIDSLPMQRSLQGRFFYPGFIGLNNMKNTDFISVVFQLLSHISPVRNFFLKPKLYEDEQRRLTSSNMQVMISFGELCRKVWNPRCLKGQVSPHEFVQQVIRSSKNRYKIGERGDPVEFFTWLVNSMKQELKTVTKLKTVSAKKAVSSSAKFDNVFDSSMEGCLEIISEKVDVKENRVSFDSQQSASKSVSPFLFLTVDIDPKLMLVKDKLHDTENTLPQVALFSLLEKYNGVKETEVPVRAGLIDKRRYRLKRLPPYLVIKVNRFRKNQFFVEKLPVIVTHPVYNMDLEPLFRESGVYPDPDDDNTLEPYKYDLHSSICHEGTALEGQYRVHIRHKETNKWMVFQDLQVGEVMPELMALAEVYFLVYERQRRSTA